MDVAVVIPFAGDDPHRLRALAWVTEQYRRHHPDWQIVIGSIDGPWCKAQAVAAGLAETDAELLVIADADVWCDGTQAAVEALHKHWWAVPHRLVHRLDLAATDALTATGEPGESYDQRPYRGFVGGGIVALRRSAYIDCPLDPRFIGWGQEDESWATALTTLFGSPWRGDRDLIHLWHPPQERQSRRHGNPAGVSLQSRYTAARRSRRAMRALIDEHLADTQDPLPPVGRSPKENNPPCNSKATSSSGFRRQASPTARKTSRR